MESDEGSLADGAEVGLGSSDIGGTGAAVSSVVVRRGVRVRRVCEPRERVATRGQ